ncbi:MAG: RNA polymerase [Euryarchaeota archaeon]|nr:RNA polymerase [Euryarchaeota archaeon]MDE1837759.1 RNA polymerase [Euryarchaeota archaeon]MDE1881133.1 RNA polymerase [Euryarchaeota archaeon]MDE2045419.1 RNA polymerase [Thermoplasmata archaeon]
MTETIPLSRVKDLLSEEAGKRTLSREAQLALAHAEASLKLTPKDTEKILEDLKAFSYLDPILATKIADILPQWPEEVRLLASKDRTLLDEEQVKAILDLTAKYR